jgi:hypothetical protein
MPAIERRICPPEFQERIDKAVGVNRYGGPLWKIVWGQTATFRAGGYWPHDNFLGYRQLMLSNGSCSGDGEACWLICEWHPPEDYGSPAMYYFENRDEYTGLQTLGEYPHKGRYEVAFSLKSAELRNGRMEVLHYQLDGFLFTWLLPMLQAAQRMKHKDRIDMAAKRKAAEDKAFDDNWEAATKSAKLARGHSTQKVLDRELMMRQQMSGFLKKYGRVRPGMHQGSFAGR